MLPNRVHTRYHLGQIVLVSRQEMKKNVSLLAMTALCVVLNRYPVKALVQGPILRPRFRNACGAGVNSSDFQKRFWVGIPVISG